MASSPVVRAIAALSFLFPLMPLADNAAAAPPVSVRQMRVEIVVAEDGTSVQTTHFETAVTTDEAARQSAQLPIAFSDAVAQLDLLDAYTQKPDGRRIPVDPSAVRVQLAPGIPNFPMYSDRKQIVAVFPDAQGGDLLVSTWRRTATRPALPGAFVYSLLLPRNVPWDDAEVAISTPSGTPLHTESHGPVQEDGTAADGRHLYRWHYSAPEPLLEDPAALAPIDRAPRLITSTVADWPALSRAYAAAFAPATVVTPRIQALADEVTRDVAEPREQARLLYEWMTRNVRWVAIYLGNDTWVPHAAEVVLANKYGDCKDQVALLIALLRAKNIAAEPVLINAGPSYTLSAPATYLAFNHAIAYLPDWTLYADTTAADAPFGTLPISEYGKPVLRLTATGADAGRIAPLAPGVAVAKLTTAATLGAGGDVSGTSNIEAAGPFVVALRMIGRSLTAQDPERFGANLLRGLHEPGHGSLTPPQVEADSGMTRMEGRFTLDRHEHWIEGDRFLLPTGMRLLTRVGDGLIGPLGLRDLPVSEPTPCHAGRQEEVLSLALPPGRHPARLPQDAAIAGSFFRYDSHWTFEEETITVRRSFESRIDAPLCAGVQREEAAKALAAIRHDIDTRIALDTPG